MIQEIRNIGEFMLGAYAHSWPYLLLTVPLAVVVKMTGISRYLDKAFQKAPAAAILLATVIGAFSPFCSCGVVPVITSLLLGGAPLAPVMSFWLASPSMDPEIFLLSVSQLGADLALWRLGATFIMSLSGGYITHILVSRQWIKGRILRLKPAEALSGAGDNSCGCSKEAPHGEIAGNARCGETGCGTSVASAPVGCCGTSGQNSEKKTAKERFGKDTLRESMAAMKMVLKFMTLAYFLEALITLYVPEAWIVSLMGGGNAFAIPLSTLISVPLYTTNLTAIGLIGGLLNQGMNPGAALAFLIGGATTTIPAMAAVFGIVRNRIFFIYVMMAFGASLLSGYLYDIFH